jgi:hypothetical protein
MTPKEKADQLLTKFINQWFAFGDYLCLYKAKQCALIAIDEILQSGPTKIVWEDDNTEIPIMDEEWWESVKQEIEAI